MPNTFMPRALDEVVEARAMALRQEVDDELSVTEWHALLDMLEDEYVEEFAELYGDVSTIPDVVSGIEVEGGGDGE